MIYVTNYVAHLLLVYENWNEKFYFDLVFKFERTYNYLVNLSTHLGAKIKSKYKFNTDQILTILRRADMIRKKLSIDE